MRRSSTAILIMGSFLWLGPCVSLEPGISIRLDAYSARAASRTPPGLFSLPSEEWSRRYDSESIVYVPGETAHLTVEVPRNHGAAEGEISLLFLISGNRRVLHRGRLERGPYGPYQVAISSDFEVYSVLVEAGDRAAVRVFYGIRPRRAMKDFRGAVPPYGISLRYTSDFGSRISGLGALAGHSAIGNLQSEMAPCPVHPVKRQYLRTTPYDEAVREGGVPLRAIDSNWALASHLGNSGERRQDWWLWTHYACGMTGLQGDRPSLFWGEHNPFLSDLRFRLSDFGAPLGHSAIGNLQSEMAPAPVRPVKRQSLAGARLTDTMLPNGIYFRERIQPMLRKWAEHLSEAHPGVPLTIFLGDDWGIAQGVGRRYGPEILRFFVSWMKELFDVTIEADTFGELIRKCSDYPEHFRYFIARNTTFRSLELTCEAVRAIAAHSKAWDKNGVSSRELIALPEAAEFCEILARCISVGTSNDRLAFELTRGHPLPYSLSNMVTKSFAPERNLCVGWTGCPPNAAEGEIYRWYLGPAWLTAYDAEGQLRHVYTHSPPKGPADVWQSLVEAGTPDEKIRIHDKCFQLTEAIAVEKPIGPVFVCKDWTFADDRSHRAWRSDLYEDFLVSLRRHKVPISCAGYADYESNLPADRPRVYAPRMNGQGEIRFGFRAGAEEHWFACRASDISDSLMAEFAIRLNGACGNPVIFPPETSIEGYAFEARGMIFIVAEEMADRREEGAIKIRVGGGQWTVLDVIAGEQVRCWREREHIVFHAGMEPNSATLFCVVRRSER